MTERSRINSLDFQDVSFVTRPEFVTIRSSLSYFCLKHSFSILNLDFSQIQTNLVMTCNIPKSSLSSLKFKLFSETGKFGNDNDIRKNCFSSLRFRIFSDTEKFDNDGPKQTESSRGIFLMFFSLLGRIFKFIKTICQHFPFETCVKVS